MALLLREQINNVYQSTQALMNWCTRVPIVYCDDFSRMNGEVYRKANKLYDMPTENASIEEEADRCLTLLSAYHLTFCDYGDKQICIQQLLTRSWYLLEHLPATALKVRLLLSCYAETYDASLLEEALSIVRTWDDTALTPEQAEAFDCLDSVESIV